MRVLRYLGRFTHRVAIFCLVVLPRRMKSYRKRLGSTFFFELQVPGEAFPIKASDESSTISRLNPISSPSFRVIGAPGRGRAENIKPSAAIKPIGNADWRSY